jgi:putative ABC transport system permease protein
LNNRDTFKQNLQQHSGIEGVTVSNGVPGRMYSHYPYASLHRKIEPLAMWSNRGDGWLVAVRISAADIPQSLKVIEQEWSRLSPGHPFSYKFLDSDFDRLYKSEQRLSAVLGAFSSLAIFIACLGLLGLASFVAEQRTKEVGIRKVLGASVADIVLLFSHDFLKLVALAFFIACPIAYVTLSQWLQNFAYRVELSIGVFAVAGVLAFICALATVSWQAIKAALANPIEALRYE